MSAVVSRTEPGEAAAAPVDPDGEPSPAEDAPGNRAPLPVRLTARFWALFALGLIAVATVATNLWWIVAHRRGLPFNIDEAGYLQRAIRNSDALHAGGLAHMVNVVRSPDPQAPLLPVTAGFVRYLTGVGPLGLIGVEQLFVLVLLAATYVATRRLASRRWAVLAAATVVTLPAILMQGRDFDFAVPAAAMVTAALAAQLCAGDFRSTPRSLWWGALLGLTALTRTMVLGLVAALVVAAIVRLVASGAGRRQVANAGAGLVLGFLVAFSWYSATWRSVSGYLTSYGYGARAAGYGPGYSFWSASWWTERLARAVSTDVFFPLTLALVACIVVGVVGFVHRAGVRARAREGGRGEGEAPRTVEGGGRVRAWLAGDVSTVVIFLVVSYLLLSSTRNVGSGFEVPLLPAAVVLILVFASRGPRSAWPIALTACGLAAGFSLLAQSGGLPGSTLTTRAATIGPISMPILDSRGDLSIYAQAALSQCGAPSVRCMQTQNRLSDDAHLRQWVAAGERETRMVHAAVVAGGRQPMLWFATEDPFFNTNTVDLDYQVEYHQVLPVGVLESPAQVKESYVSELLWTNLVIVGPRSRGLWARSFPNADPVPVHAALRTDGFHQIGSLRLPDGRVMQLWWKAQGAPRSS